MPWGRLDDRLHDNGKVWSLSDRGFRVWMYSVSYCNAKRDKDPSGRLTEAEAEAVCRIANSTTPAAIRRVMTELLAKRPPRDTSFWERDGSALLVHDFPDFGPKLDLTAAERQRRRRGKGASHGDVTRDAHADVTHPVPVPGPVPMSASTQTEHQPEQQTAVQDMLLRPPEAASLPDPPKSLDPRYSADFEAFWPVYPRHRDKAPAFKAYQALLKRGATPEQLRSAAEHFAAYVEQSGTEEEHVPYAATWLNEGKWLDFRDGVPAPAVPARRSPVGNGRGARPSAFDQIDVAIAHIEGGGP